MLAKAREAREEGKRLRIWDRGTYKTEKWTDDEIKVVIHGSHVSGATY
jgi:hypothetical protein